MQTTLLEILSKSNMCFSTEAGMDVGAGGNGARINNCSVKVAEKELQTRGQTEHFGIYCFSDNTVRAFHPGIRKGFIVLTNKGSELLRK